MRASSLEDSSFSSPAGGAVGKPSIISSIKKSMISSGLTLETKSHPLTVGEKQRIID
jgi:hypothetical protein